MKKFGILVAFVALALPVVAGAQTTLEWMTLSAVADAKVAGPFLAFNKPSAVADAKVAGPFLRTSVPTAVADAKVAGIVAFDEVADTYSTADGRTILDLNASK